MASRVDVGSEYYNGWTEEQLVAELKQSKDFHLLPIPVNWSKKYDIPFPEAANMKTYLKENHWLKCRYEPGKEVIVINEPAPGGVRPTIDVEPVKAITVPGDVTKNPELLEKIKDENASCNEQDSVQKK